MLTKSISFHIPSHVISQKLEQNMILIHTHSNRIFDLNSTGARLWELLSSGFSIVAAHKQLLQEFEVTPEQLDSEIEHTIQFLLKENLLESQ